MAKKIKIIGDRLHDKAYDGLVVAVMDESAPPDTLPEVAYISALQGAGDVDLQAVVLYRGANGKVTPRSLCHIRACDWIDCPGG